MKQKQHHDPVNSTKVFRSDRKLYISLLLLHLRIVYLHLLVYPGLKVADVAMDTNVVLSAFVPPDCVPSEPPNSILQGHQRAATIGLTKS